LLNSCALPQRLPEIDAAMREIVLDTETTGLSPADGHRVVEIGAVEIVHQVQTGKIYHALINPERDVPPDAARVHGHTAAVLNDKPVFASIVDEFLAFIGDATLVIHNADFDVRFINAELTRLGREAIGVDRVVDTLTLARRKHPGQPNSLDALCDRYRIDRSRRVKHGALLDAEILVEIYCELTGGRQRSLAFSDAEETAAPFAVLLPSSLGARLRRRSPVEGEEASAHARYIQTLGDNAIWLLYLPRPI
jgi:DNA polymerase-3 subunit epsilon